MKTLAAIAAVGAGAFALAGGSAVAETGDRGADATISMNFSKGAGPFFAGDNSIPAGGKLKLVNLSDPKQIGPHTFSLVEKADLPSSNSEFKNCFKSGVCGEIASAHELTKNDKVKKPLVDEGDEGWDTAFSDGAAGDTWYTQTEKEKLIQVVSPEAGPKLFFMCAVHPDMQGKLKVTAAE